MRSLVLSASIVLASTAALAQEARMDATKEGAPTDTSSAADVVGASGPPPAPPPALPSAADPNNLTPAESMAWRDLREVVIRERTIWDRLLKNPDDDQEQQRANAEFRSVITAYENVIRAAPKFAEAYAAYGLLLNRTGNRDQAVRVMLQANQLNPSLPMVKNEIGNYLFEEGRYKDALGYYLAAIQLKEAEPLYHYQLGSLLREYRRFFIADGIFNPATIDQKMQAAFRRAAELAPDTWGYTYRYAESFYDVDAPDWTNALAEWTKLEAKAKPGVEKQTIHLQQANVLARMGRTEEARALVDSIVEPTLFSAKEQVMEIIDAPPPAEPEPKEATSSDAPPTSPAEPAPTAPAVPPVEPTPSPETQSSANDDSAPKLAPTPAPAPEADAAVPEDQGEKPVGSE